MKHHIVFLEAANAPSRAFSFPHTTTRYTHTKPSEISSRIADATIAVLGVSALTAAHLDSAQNLRCIAVTATGYEWLNRDAFAARGVTVVHCPQSNVDAVAEHFLALYFAARNKTIEMHAAVSGPERAWVKEGSLTGRWRGRPPRSCAQETLGIIGYGALGRRIEGLAASLEFGRVLLAERKRTRCEEGDVRKGRVAFREVLAQATVVVVCCPKDADTLSLIAEEELDLMREDALLINLSRGGVVCEKALAVALRKGRIGGGATDVLETEPGGMGTSPLIPETSEGERMVPNITITPHLAWYSQKTMGNLAEMLKMGIEGYVAGDLTEDPRSRGLIIVHQGRVWK